MAHRGCSRLHGDNTMASYRNACYLGVDAIEMDVCITKDQVLVLNHNPVDKTTGVPINSRNVLGTDLRLDDVLREFKDERFECILDIKDARVYSGICRDIYELCIRYKCLDRCVIGSFSEFHLRDLCNIEKATGSTLKKAYITSNMKEDLFSSTIDTFQVTHLIIYKFQVTQGAVDRCHESGVQVYAYTCNTLGLHSYIASLGCDGIVTDVPGSFPSSA